VLKTAGADADYATPDVIHATRKTLGGEFNRLSTGKTVKLGDDFVNKLAEVDSAAAEVRGMLPTENIDKLVNGALDLAAKGELKGETAQVIRSELTKEAKAAAASGNNRLKDAVTTVQKCFR
jgi:polyhydroxyalkanoate synthesis regulator phasin